METVISQPCERRHDHSPYLRLYPTDDIRILISPSEQIDHDPLARTELSRRMEELRGNFTPEPETAEEVFRYLETIELKREHVGNPPYDGEGYFPFAYSYEPGNLKIFASYSPQDTGGYFRSIALSQAEADGIQVLNAHNRSYNLCVAAVVSVVDPHGDERIVLGSGQKKRWEIPAGGFQPGHSPENSRVGSPANQMVDAVCVSRMMYEEIHQELGIAEPDMQVFNTMRPVAYVPPFRAFGKWTSPFLLFSPQVSQDFWDDIMARRKPTDHTDNDYFMTVLLKKPSEIDYTAVRHDAACMIRIWSHIRNGGR